MQKIDMNKTYQTIKGADVVLLRTYKNRHGEQMVVGLVEEEDGSFFSTCWYVATGEYIKGSDSHHNLVEVDHFKKFRDLPVDTPVWVRDSELDAWHPRHWRGLSGSNQFPFSTFCAGQTYHSMQDEAEAVDWKYCSIKNPYKS